jgi:molybdate transport system regulatory protein
MKKKVSRTAEEIITQKDFSGRIWINGKQGIFLGHGRVELLERIREYGSITKAAKSMKMAYRRAWQLVDSMNRQATRPLVMTATGGRGGGGAHLTESGEKAIKLFREFHADFQNFLRHEGISLKL